MNKSKYKVRHITCNMEDFNTDCHRFRFEYNGKEYVAHCYFALTVMFGENENEIPEEVREEIKNIIWDKIDKEESTWSYPEEAYRIADKYAEDEFSLCKED